MSIIVLGVYISCATKSPLWYDEAIEYFFSKFANGAVPGGRSMDSMYARICSTYQPPLYNWLMHIWLTFFDTEFSFRMAGIITSLLGGLGFFLGLNKVTNEKYAALGTFLYHITTSVAYYALECAEYNLMLSCICWTLYFFVSYLVDSKKNYLVGFFCFAILSVYSQYGASFLVLILYLLLAWKCIRKKSNNKKLFFILSAIAAIFAALLITLFLIPQIINQGTTSISHTPYFAYGNIIYDFIAGIFLQVNFSFCIYSQYFFVIRLIIKIVAIMTIFSILFNKDEKLRILATATLIIWIIYYLAVACSIYGYNNWNATRIGTGNIGGRYGLFLVPLWCFILLYGFYTAPKINVGKLTPTWKLICKYLGIFLTLLFVFSSCNAISNFPPKDDVREITDVWYSIQGYNETTLIHNWSDSIFQYYLIHDDRYNEEYQEHIINTSYSFRDANEVEMEIELAKLGIFNYSSFYYVTQLTNSPTNVSTFLSVMKKHGYEAASYYSGTSCLLILTKTDS